MQHVVARPVLDLFQLRTRTTPGQIAAESTTASRRSYHDPALGARFADTDEGSLSGADPERARPDSVERSRVIYTPEYAAGRSNNGHESARRTQKASTTDNSGQVPGQHCTTRRHEPRGG